MQLMDRLKRLSVLAVGLGSLAACNVYEGIAGQWGDPGNSSGMGGHGSNGWIRVSDLLSGAGACVNEGCSDPCWPTSVGSNHFTGQLGQAIRHSGAIKNYRRYGGAILAPNTCPFTTQNGGFQPSFEYNMIANPPGPKGIASGMYALAMTTDDTNGDGHISGAGTNFVPGSPPDPYPFDGSPTCENIFGGISAVQALLDPVWAPAWDPTPATTNSWLGRDDTVCLNPPKLGGVPSAPQYISLTTTLGGFLNANIMRQLPGASDGLFDSLPLEIKADLLNSVDTETDVQHTSFGDVVTFHVTGVRVYGATYSPRGISLTMQPGGQFQSKLLTGPGGRLLAAWMADRVQQFVNAGGKTWSQLRASITVNDSVVVPLSDLDGRNGGLALKLHDPSQGMVDVLRRVATLR